MPALLGKGQFTRSQPLVSGPRAGGDEPAVALTPRNALPPHRPHGCCRKRNDPGCATRAHPGSVWCSPRGRHPPVEGGRGWWATLSGRAGVAPVPSASGTGATSTGRYDSESRPFGCAVSCASAMPRRRRTAKVATPPGSARGERSHHLSTRRRRTGSAWRRRRGTSATSSAHQPARRGADSQRAQAGGVTRARLSSRRVRPKRAATSRRCSPPTTDAGSRVAALTSAA